MTKKSFFLSCDVFKVNPFWVVFEINITNSLYLFQSAKILNLK